MKRLRLSEIARKPAYLGEFPLPGREIGSIDELIQKEEGIWQIKGRGEIPLAERVVKDQCYAIADAEVKVVLRDMGGPIIQPLTPEDEDLLKEIVCPCSISEIQIVKIRTSDHISVGERLEFQKVIAAQDAIRNNPDYGFQSEFLQAALKTESAIAELAEFDKQIESADEEGEGAIAEQKEKRQGEILIAALEQQTARDRERAANEDVLNYQMLDLSRRQLEILGGLKEGALATLDEPVIREILSMVNTPDEEESKAETPTKPKRGKKAAAAA